VSDVPPALRERKATNPRLPTPSKTVLISENAATHMHRVLSDPDMLGKLGDLASLEQMAVCRSPKSKKKKSFFLIFLTFFFFFFFFFLPFVFLGTN
jgi:hypothetical protein